MRIASIIARYLLGLIFLVFGLNGFLHFIPMPPPKGLAAQFGGAIINSPFSRRALVSEFATWAS